MPPPLPDVFFVSLVFQSKSGVRKLRKGMQKQRRRAQPLKGQGRDTPKALSPNSL